MFSMAMLHYSNANHLFLNNMNDSTLDLFVNEGIHRFVDNDILMNLEELSARHEVTVDYYIMEFLIDEDDTDNEEEWELGKWL